MIYSILNMKVYCLGRFFATRFKGLKDVMELVGQNSPRLDHGAQRELEEFLEKNYKEIDVDSTVKIADILFVNSGYFKSDTVFRHLHAQFDTLSTTRKVKLLHLISKQGYPVELFRRKYSEDIPNTLKQITTDTKILGVYVVCLSKILKFTPDQEDQILSYINQVNHILNPKHIINLIANSKGRLQEHLVDILADPLIKHAQHNSIIKEHNTKNHPDFRR
jgi:hypothetical protein